VKISVRLWFRSRALRAHLAGSNRSSSTPFGTTVTRRAGMAPSVTSLLRIRSVTLATWSDQPGSQRSHRSPMNRFIPPGKPIE
jgi:hypothetical protein